MTQHTGESIDQFKALKNTVRRSKTELFRRRREAENSGNFDLAASLVTARRRLDDATNEIARAEKAFLFSPAEVQTLIGKLEGAVNGAKEAQKKMKRLQTALAGAEQIVALLGALVGLLA